MVRDIHSLLNLDQGTTIERTVDVIAAFFDVLGTKDLLNIFQAITQQVQKEYDDSQNEALPNQPSMAADQVLSLKYRVFFYQFWLTIISDNDVDRLRYFLHSLLVFYVIPGIISQVLQLGKYDDALKLAKEIHEIPGITEIFKGFKNHAPDYFEFIMIQAIEGELDGFDDFRVKTQKMGKLKINLLYRCFRGHMVGSSWHGMNTVFKLRPSKDVSAWQQRYLPLCEQLYAKHLLMADLDPESLVDVVYSSYEDTSNLFEPDAEQHQG
ncbi:hypothetical protein H4R35_003228 [Dimargaris xerosporica]|nr:hypothetical protein H4R35_003228 [Dimargaris xerosporica]